MAKANAEATAERVDHLQSSWPGRRTRLVSDIRDKHGGLSDTGYKLIKRAWRQVHDDIEGPDLDQQEMLAWCVQTLLETAG